MDNYTAKDFGKLLKRNALQMRRIMLQSDTDVMRIYDRNLSELPVTVDLYGQYARITDYCEPALSQEDVDSVCDIVSRMVYIEPERVVYHHREKLRGKEQHEAQDEQSLLVTVREQGLQFTVDLKRRIDTGLFLDQIAARQALREISRGLRVLNLFSYTGSFSVYAAAGGATEVVSVDLSATYTNWCQQNLSENGFSGTAYPCICQDALQFVREAAKARRKFDVVVLDPPSFSNSRKMEHDFDVQRDYIQFIQHINALLVVGGKLLFSTNLGGFRFEKRKIRGYHIREVTRDIAATGFSMKKSSLRSWILEKNEDVSLPLKEEERKNAPVTEEKSTEAADVAKEAPAQKMAGMDNNEGQEDDPLVLNWDEQESETSPDETKNAKQRRYERRHPGETAAPVAEATAERQEKEPRDRSIERRNNNRDDRRPRRDGDRPEGRRSFDRDRPPRRFDDRDDRRPRRDDDRPQGGRSFDRDRPPRRFDDRDDRRPRRDDDRPQGGRSFDRDRPPRRFDDRDDRRPRRDGDRPEGRRSFDRDRPPRRFDDRDDRRPRRDDDRPQGGRSFDRDRPPRRFDDRDDRRPRRDDDRPQGGRSFDRDRPPRRFDDRDDRRPRRDDDRPQGGRSFDRDRPPRRFDDRDDRRPRRDDDRPQGRRSFDRDRPPRRFDDRDDRRPRRDDDRPQGGRSFDRDRAPRRFDDRQPRRFEDDRSQGGRSFDRDRSSGGKKGPKPYGYDRFKPTRDRGSDKETFFRLEDEVDKDR